MDFSCNSNVAQLPSPRLAQWYDLNDKAKTIAGIKKLHILPSRITKD